MENKLSLHECYHKIINVARARTGQRGQLVDYAASYAKHGLTLKDAREPAELTPDQRTQALYVRSNLGTWRSPTGKEVRTNMDRILKKEK